MLATWGTSTGFNPASLFAGGVQGAWYDPSDFPPNWRVNLLTYTEQFNNTAGWTALNATVTANATVAPDGTTTADKLIENTATGLHTVLQSPFLTITSGATYTLSIYAKAAERTILYLRDNGTSNVGVYFDLVNGVITSQDASVVAASITAVGSGWYRCVVTYVAGSTTGNPQPRLVLSGTTQSYTGDGTSGLFIWGIQFEAGSTATAYQQIVTPEISFLQYNPQPVMFTDSLASIPVTAVEQGVGAILDKRNGVPSTARYNLVSFSEQFNNALWVLLNAAIVADSTTAPNGTTTADTLNVTSASNVRKYVEQGIVPSGATTFSVYVKAGTQNFVQLYANADAQAFVNFDVSAGTVGTAGTKTTGSITSVGDGWYRCVASFDATTVYTAGTFRVAMVGSASATFAATTTVTGTFFLWGAQLQSGSSATTYQPTTAYPTSWPSGNHAFQTTSASRPTLRARYNLLTYSEEFNNAAWTNLNTKSVTANSDIAPDGTLTADTITDASVGFFDGCAQIATVISGQSYTFSIYVKKTVGAPSIWPLLQIDRGGSSFYGVLLNTQTGQTTTLAGGSYAAPTSVSTTEISGYYRLVIVGTANSTSYQIQVYPAASTDGTTTSTAAIGSNVFWGAQLTQTAVFPSNTYQRIAAATDYATGAAFPQYLAFDGTDDSLLTANVDFATVTSDGAARRNLLLNPTQFDAAAWTLSNATVTANSTAAPDSTTTADTLVENTATSIHAITSSSVTYAASSQYALSIYAKPSGRNWILVQFPTVPFGATTRAWFNVSAGTVGTRENCTGTIADAGNGWFRCTMVATTTVGGAGTSAFYTSTGDGLSSYTGDGVSGLFLWGAQIELGSTATAFQNIGTDKMTVWSGLSKLTDSAAGACVVEQSANASINAGFFIFAPANASQPEYGIAVRGSALNRRLYTTYTAPITNVLATSLSTEAANSAAAISTKINGATVAGTDSLSNASTGTFPNAALFIGRRNNASAPLNGRIYSLIVRGAASNSSQVAQTERYVASKTPLGVVP